MLSKTYACYNVDPHTTKKQLQATMKPFFFPALTPTELKNKKVLYMLFLFPKKDVIEKQLSENKYNIGHILTIVNISAWLQCWRSDGNPEIICDWCGKTFSHKKN